MDRLKKLEELFDEHFDRTAPGYDRFAEILSGLAGKSGRPWQKTFIYNLLNKTKGYKVGDQMWAALLAFEKERTLAMRRHIVLSMYDVPSAAIAVGRPVQCAWCDEWLIPDHPNRKYCPHNRCRLDARNQRRRGK
jgi:hypothetical protein